MFFAIEFVVLHALRDNIVDINAITSTLRFI